MDSGRGALTLSLPLGTVPGEIPIPLCFTMNGTFMAHCGAVLPVPGGLVSLWRNLGAHGTVGFGYIGWGRMNKGAGNRMVVLEDGRSFGEPEFVAGRPPYGTGILAAYGIAGNPVSFRISSDGSLAWAIFPPGQLTGALGASLSRRLPAGYGNVSALHVLADRDRLRILAEVEARCPAYLPTSHVRGMDETTTVALPVVWADRFKHAVTFQWTRATNGMPPGIASLERVDALNARGKGVTVRFANWSEPTGLHDLLRADFVGFEGPSVLMRGYSGTSLLAPSGYQNPYKPKAGEASRPVYLAGPVVRPTTIIQGDSGTLALPSWNGSGSFPSIPPATGPRGNGGADRVWTLEYDGNLASLATLTTPGLVRTEFRSDTRYTLFEGPGTLPALLWGVTRARSVDVSGRSGYAHETTWTRTLPEAHGDGWSQPEWKVTLQDGWEGGDGAPANRTTTLQYVSPAQDLLDFRNMTIQSTRVTDGADALTTTLATTTRGGRGGGLDGKLTFPAKVTTTRSGEHDREVIYQYGDETCLQVRSAETRTLAPSGPRLDLAERFEYEDGWALLAGHLVRATERERFRSGASTGQVDRTVNEWDPGTLLLKKTFREGGGIQHGQAFNYRNDGKRTSESVWHLENGQVAPSPRNTTIYYAPENGQPWAWGTSFMEEDGRWGALATSVGPFDGAERPIQRTDGRGVLTRLAYDLFGREIRSESQGSAPILTEYPDPWTRCQRQSGRVTTEHLDGFGRTLGFEEPEGTRSEFAYDAFGRLASETRVSTAGSRIRHTTAFDLLDRPRSRRDFDGTTVTFEYAPGEGGFNQMVRSFQGLQPARILVDPFGQVVQETAATGDVTRITYDGFGTPIQVEMISAQDGARQVRTYSTDALGRRTGKTEPETGAQAVLSFDALNHPIRIREGGTCEITQVFDGLDRLRRRVGSEGGASATEAFTFSGSFLLCASRQVSGKGAVTQQFEYGLPSEGARLRRETSSAPGFAYQVGYTYNDLGAVASLTYPDGRTVSYGFDGIGRPVSVRSATSGYIQEIVPAPQEPPFDPWGHRASLVFGSGARQSWSVDSTQARPGSSLVLPRSGAPMGWSYGYEPATGRLTGTGEWDLELDRLGRLSHGIQRWRLAQGTGGTPETQGGSLLTASFRHDAFGNNTQSIYDAPGGLLPALNTFTLASSLPDNHLPANASPAGIINAIYDSRGRLQSVATGISSGQYLDMTWDPFGELATLRQTSTGAIESFDYAPSGTRISRNHPGDPSQDRWFAYTSKGCLLAEALSGNRWTRDVVYLEGRAIAELDGAGVHELHSDHLQTPRVITNGATGAVEGGQGFGLFGEALGSWGYFPLTGYTGHIQTEPSGLIYMRGRFYSPQYHRFLNPDSGKDQSPEDTQSWNLNSYVRNDPVSLLDPSGMGGVPFQTNQWKVQGMRRAGMSDAQIASQMWKDSQIGTLGAVAGLTLNSSSILSLARTFPSVSQISKGWLLSTGSAWLQELKEWIGFGAEFQQAAQKETLAVSWGPATGTGPLSREVVSSFRSGSFSEITLEEPLFLFRAYGGRAKELGAFWTRTRPLGTLQTRIDSAILPEWGNTLERVTAIRVPAGATIYDGFAAPQEGLMGGGSQVYIPHVDPSWIMK